MTETKILAIEAISETAGKSAPVLLRLTLIGQMEARTRDDASVLPLGRKTRALLAILALSAPRPVVRSRLAELLWSRRHEEQARASLRQEIHRLLDALQPTGGEVLTVTRDHVSLRLDHVSIDVEEVLHSTPADPSGLELLKGKLLDEFDGIDPAFDIWLAAERERLQDRARALGEGLLRQEMDPEALIPIAQRLLGIDRAHEGAWRALMGAYAARGDRGMAVQAYERCRAVLKEKLDAAPSMETQRLLAGIRAGNGSSARHETLPAELRGMHRAGMRLGVLPLQMLGTDTAEAHLSLSLADELTAALSAFQPADLVSSSSLQQNGSRDESVLRRIFDLDFLVDGSVQRSGGQLRITIRLVDLEDGNRIVWAHRFDHDASDLLSLQDNVTADVAGKMYPEIIRAEARRATARPLANATPYDLRLRAIPLMARLRRDDFDEAGALLGRALAADPDGSASHALRAYWLTLGISQGWSQDINGVRIQAGELVERAIALDHRDAGALAIAGLVRSYLHRRPCEALELHDRALAVNPNLPLAVQLSALTLIYLGDLDAASARCARYERLAPSGQPVLFFDSAQTLLEILQRNHAAAVRSGRRSAELHPHLVAGLKHYLCALGHAGLHAEAKLVLRRLLALQPRFTIERALAVSPLNRPDDLAHYIAGLRLAGVPEDEIVLV